MFNKHFVYLYIIFTFEYYVYTCILVMMLLLVDMLEPWEQRVDSG